MKGWGRAGADLSASASTAITLFKNNKLCLDEILELKSIIPEISE